MCTGMGIPVGFLHWVQVQVTRSGQKPVPVTMGTGMGTQLISMVCRQKVLQITPNYIFFILDQKFRKSQKVLKLFVVLQSKFTT